MDIVIQKLSQIHSQVDKNQKAIADQQVMMDDFINRPDGMVIMTTMTMNMMSMIIRIMMQSSWMSMMTLHMSPQQRKEKLRGQTMTSLKKAIPMIKTKRGNLPLNWHWPNTRKAKKKFLSQ